MGGFALNSRLCHSCHKKYDSKAPKSVEQKQSVTAEHGQPPATKSTEGHLPITLDPPDPDIFKQELLVSKKALIETTYNDGRVEQKQWNADRFKASSNVFGNLRSRPEYRAGNWQQKGVIKVHVKVIKNA